MFAAHEVPDHAQFLGGDNGNLEAGSYDFFETCEITQCDD